MPILGFFFVFLLNFSHGGGFCPGVDVLKGDKSHLVSVLWQLEAVPYVIDKSLFYKKMHHN